MVGAAVLQGFLVDEEMRGLVEGWSEILWPRLETEAEEENGDGVNERTAIQEARLDAAMRARENSGWDEFWS